VALQDFFPFSPDYMSWDDWNGNLVIFFEEEAVPVNPEESWQQTAAAINQMPRFLSYALPDPTGFASWQDWADAFTALVNGPSR